MFSLNLDVLLFQMVTKLLGRKCFLGCSDLIINGISFGFGAPGHRGKVTEYQGCCEGKFGRTSDVELPVTMPKDEWSEMSSVIIFKTVNKLKSPPGCCMRCQS